MRAYNKIKNMIISLLSAAFYCYSCMTVEGNHTGLIIFGTIGIFSSVFVIMFEVDLMFLSCRHNNRSVKNGKI